LDEENNLNTPEKTIGAGLAALATIVIELYGYKE
jgi:hypothetical protein